MALNIFSQHSIKTKITASSLVIFVISIWSLAFYTSRMLREDMERMLSEKQFSVASFMAATVNDELDERLRLLEEISKQITPALLRNPGKRKGDNKPPAGHRPDGTFNAGRQGTASGSRV